MNRTLVFYVSLNGMVSRVGGGDRPFLSALEPRQARVTETLDQLATGADWFGGHMDYYDLSHLQITGPFSKK